MLHAQGRDCQMAEVLGDFADHDCPKCGNWRMRLARDASYSRVFMVWKCSDHKTCNKKVSIRRGTEVSLNSGADH